MFKKNTFSGRIDQYEQAGSREKIEITIRRLQELKDKVSELKSRCEELKGLSLKNKASLHSKCEKLIYRSIDPVQSNQEVVENEALLCSECGNTIDPNQQVAVKDSAGIEKRHYHMKCFQALLK